MTTQNTTPSSIDEKKSETKGFTPDIKGFFVNYAMSLVITISIGIFIVGGTGLFTTKVAQANILPDNIKLAPYVPNMPRIVQKLPININVMRPSVFSEIKDSEEFHGNQFYFFQFKFSTGIRHYVVVLFFWYFSMDGSLFL